MIITLNLDKEHIQESLEIFFTKFICYLYSWLSNDGEVIGYIIGVFHVLIAASVPLISFISHTIYPNFWLKLFNFICLFFIFMQHVIFNICLLIPMEERLTKQQTIFYPLLEKIIKPTGVDVNQFITYIVIAEGFTALCFGLELFSYVSRFVYKYYGIDI
jgi:hypothetical protein